MKNLDYYFTSEKVTGTTATIGTSTFSGGGPALTTAPTVKSLEHLSQRISESLDALLNRITGLNERMHGAGISPKHSEEVPLMPMAANLFSADKKLELCHQAISETEKSLFQS